MLSCVIHCVPKEPGVLAAAGMTYVSLTCAASGRARKRRRTANLKYPEAFTVKPFRVPATSGTVARAAAFPRLTALLDRHEVPLPGPGVDLPRPGGLLIWLVRHRLPLG